MRPCVRRATTLTAPTDIDAVLQTAKIALAEAQSIFDAKIRRNAAEVEYRKLKTAAEKKRKAELAKAKAAESQDEDDEEAFEPVPPKKKRRLRPAPAPDDSE